MSAVNHWLWQRYTSVLMVPGCVWLLYVIGNLVSKNQPLRVLLEKPFSSVIFTFTALAMLHHGVSGMEMIIKDYVKNPVVEFSVMTFIKGSSVIIGVLAVLAMLKVVIL